MTQPDDLTANQIFLMLFYAHGGILPDGKVWTFRSGQALNEEYAKEHQESFDGLVSLGLLDRAIYPHRGYDQSVNYTLSREGRDFWDDWGEVCVAKHAMNIALDNRRTRR